MSSTLTEDEIDDVLYDSRAGDLESLQDFFKIHQNNTSSEDLLLQIKDEYSLKTPLHNAAANGHSSKSLSESLFFFLALTFLRCCQISNIIV